MIADWFSIKSKPPWQVFIIGAATIPFLTIGFIVLAALGAVITGENIVDYIRIGSILGLICAMISVLHVFFAVIQELIQREMTLKSAALYIMGYSWMWAVIAAIIYYFIIK